MILADANRAIVDRFAAQWPILRPSVPFVLDNEIADSPAAITGGWVRLVADEVVSRQHTLGERGNRIFRRAGLALAQCFAPIGGGARLGLELGEDVRTIYEGEDFGGVSTYAVNVRKIGPDAASGGRWWLVLVEIPFDFDHRK